MLRKATADDLPALTALRCGAAKANPVDAAGWLQNVAGLENILVLEKNGQPAAMLAAVPVKYGQHRGVWLCGAAGVQGVPMDRLLPKIMEGCLRAYGASGFDFAVTTPDDARRAEDLKTLGFKSQLPLRVIQTPIRRDLFAQAAFDSLTVHKLLERRHIYQPGCISLPEEAMNETMTQLYRRGLTVVSTRARLRAVLYQGRHAAISGITGRQRPLRRPAFAGRAGKDRCGQRPHPAGREPDALPRLRPPLRLRNDRLFRPPLLRDRCVFQDAAVRGGPIGKPRKACTVGAGHFGKGCGPHMWPLQTAALIGCKSKSNTA